MLTNKTISLFFIFINFGWKVLNIIVNWYLLISKFTSQSTFGLWIICRRNFLRLCWFPLKGGNCFKMCISKYCKLHAHSVDTTFICKYFMREKYLRIFNWNFAKQLIFHQFSYPTKRQLIFIPKSIINYLNTCKVR
jgi:hypothetical protein